MLLEDTFKVWPLMNYPFKTVTEGILGNIQLLEEYFNDDWNMRVYHDIQEENPLMKELCKIACEHSKLHLCPIR